MSFNYSDSLTVEDFKRHPVWEFTNSHEHTGPKGELVVRPVLNLPVRSLEGRFIGTELYLGNQKCVFGVLLGVKLLNLRLTKLILDFIVYMDGKRFVYRRRMESSKARQLDQLALFLDTPKAEIFPIRYDISQYVVGDPDVIRGEIIQEPPERLSTKELSKLILEEQKNSGGLT